MSITRYPGRQQGEAFEESLCEEAATSSDAARLQLLAAKGGPLAIEVARNPHTPPALLEALSRDDDLLVRCAVAQNPSATHDLRVSMLEGPSSVVLQAFIAYAQPEELLQRFSTTAHSLVLKVAIRKALAEHLYTPLPALSELSPRWRSLIWRGRRRLLESAVRDPSRLTPHLARLKDQSDPWLQAAIFEAARDPSSSPALLSMLGSLTEINVPAWLASNPSTPSSMLASFASDPSLSYSVASNPSTPPALLEELSEKRALHPQLASNPGAPPSLLLRLVSAGDNAVGWALLRNPNAPAEALAQLLSMRDAAYFLSALLAHANTSVDTLYAIARRRGLDSNQKVLLLQHPRCTPEVLLLIKLDDYTLRLLANNARVKEEVMVRLVLDPRLFGSNALPRLLRSAPLPAEALLSLAQRRRISVDTSLALAEHPSTPTEALDLLSQQRSPRVRALLAQHPNTSTETLRALSLSKVASIRDPALARLS